MYAFIQERLTTLCGKDLRSSTNEEVFRALLQFVQEQADTKQQPVNGKKLYYISAEFLIGKLLSNNLSNLGIYQDGQACLAEAG